MEGELEIEGGCQGGGEIKELEGGKERVGGRRRSERPSRREQCFEVSWEMDATADAAHPSSSSPVDWFIHSSFLTS